MKGLTVILISFALVMVTQQQQELPPLIIEFWNQLFGPYQEECIAESGVKPVLVDRGIRNMEFPSDRKLACFIKCMGMRLNFIGQNGDFLVGNVTETIGVPSEIIQHCIKLKGFDYCDNALFYARCAYSVITKWQKTNN